MENSTRIKSVDVVIGGGINFFEKAKGKDKEDLIFNAVTSGKLWALFGKNIFNKYIQTIDKPLKCHSERSEESINH